MYRGIVAALDAAAADPSVRVAVLTGAGDYYSSGNDLTNFTKNMPAGADGPKRMAAEASVVLVRCAQRAAAVAIVARTHARLRP